ncbi:unnamed protein product, partial [Discosporangium mesarthrocarpum]
LTSTACRQVARAGPGAPMPPFARNKAPDYLLDENHELVWDDGVAPETCIDFDAPHLSTGEALSWLAMGFGFFATLFGLVSLSDPDSKRVAVRRAETLPATAYDPRDLYRADGGKGESSAGDEEEEEGEEEEEEEE